MAGRIVVGVDGSEHAGAALKWAAEEARVRGATLVPVHAWTFIPPQQMVSPDLMAMPAGDMMGDLEAEENAASRALDTMLAGIDGDVEARLVEGDAAEAILEEAENADLVVVGSRGRSGLKSALLGSVSNQIIQHASCPVVIVRA